LGLLLELVQDFSRVARRLVQLSLPLVQESFLFLRVSASLATRTRLFSLFALLLCLFPKVFAGDPDFFRELALVLSTAALTKVFDGKPSAPRVPGAEALA
jgi:hypothetical protein